MTTEITIAWPTAPLTEQQWRTRLEALAVEAEGMIGKTTSLQAQAQLALHWIGLCWPAVSAEVIAGSCRASLLLGPPGVVMSSAPADQLQEIADRLDAIWEAARDDASAEVATVGPPLLELPPGAYAPKGRPPRVEPKPVPVVEPEPPAPAPEPVETVVQAPEPAAPPLPPPPDGWLVGREVSELLSVSLATVRNWREAGRFGPEGTGWGRKGKHYLYSPDMVEQLEQGKIPAIGLHQPLNDDADALPAGWESPPG
jgi:hypothetical protein